MNERISCCAVELRLTTVTVIALDLQNLTPLPLESNGVEARI